MQGNGEPTAEIHARLPSVPNPGCIQGPCTAFRSEPAESSGLTALGGVVAPLEGGAELTKPQSAARDTFARAVSRPRCKQNRTECQMPRRYSGRPHAGRRFRRYTNEAASGESLLMAGAMIASYPLFAQQAQPIQPTQPMPATQPMQSSQAVPSAQPMQAMPAAAPSAQGALSAVRDPDAQGAGQSAQPGMAPAPVDPTLARSPNPSMDPASMSLAPDALGTRQSFPRRCLSATSVAIGADTQPAPVSFLARCKSRPPLPSAASGKPGSARQDSSAARRSASNGPRMDSVKQDVRFTDKHLGRRIDSSELQPVLTCCLT